MNQALKFCWIFPNPGEWRQGHIAQKSDDKSFRKKWLAFLQKVEKDENPPENSETSLSFRASPCNVRFLQGTLQIWNSISKLNILKEKFKDSLKNGMSEWSFWEILLLKFHCSQCISIWMCLFVLVKWNVRVIFWDGFPLKFHFLNAFYIAALSLCFGSGAIGKCILYTTPIY